MNWSLESDLYLVNLAMYKLVNSIREINLQISIYLVYHLIGSNPISPVAGLPIMDKFNQGMAVVE